MTSTLLTISLMAAAQAAPPEEWTCDAAQFADDACDCGCGAVDDDCSSSSSDVCERDNCPEGQVAWEQNNESCMDEGGCAAAPIPLFAALMTLLACRRPRLIANKLRTRSFR